MTPYEECDGQAWSSGRKRQHVMAKLWPRPRIIAALEKRDFANEWGEWNQFLDFLEDLHQRYPKPEGKTHYRPDVRFLLLTQADRDDVPAADKPA